MSGRAASADRFAHLLRKAALTCGNNSRGLVADKLSYVN
jgi:hypothetical protein